MREIQEVGPKVGLEVRSVHSDGFPTTRKAARRAAPTAEGKRA